MKIARSKDKISFARTKRCLMKKAHELHQLCGNPVCTILYDPFSKQTETWSPQSVSVDSIVSYYSASIATTARRKKKKTINLTLSDLPATSSVKKIWEKELPDCMADFPTQKLVAMDGKIDATLRKIDAMLMAGNQDKRLPTKVDRFDALIEKNQPVYLCANDSEMELSNFVRLLMSDHDTQFGGETRSSNGAVDVCQNQGLFLSNAMSMVGPFNQPPPLFCSNPPFDQSGYGTLANGNQYMVDWEPSSTHLQPLDSSSSSHQPAGNQMLHPQSMPVNGGGDMGTQHGVEFGNIFNTLFSDQ